MKEKLAEVNAQMNPSAFRVMIKDLDITPHTATKYLAGQGEKISLYDRIFKFFEHEN